jgi:hypothetical protein
MALVPTIYVAALLVQIEDVGNDFAIPLAAADRWVNGERVYDPESFGVVTGPGLPFLYPPLVLPILSPLLGLPHEALVWLARLVCLVAGLFICHRLRLPAWTWPLFLLARPFSEAILAANVQIVLVAAFAALFFRRGPGRADFRPLHWDPADESRSDLTTGVLAAATPTIKVTQVQAFVYVLRWRPRAAIVGLLLVAALGVASLPLVGIDLWFEWLAQLERARLNGGPAGMAPVTYLGSAIGLSLLALSVLAVLRVPRREAGTWVGILTVIGAASLHAHGFAYLLPAWLAIRREIALVATIFGASLWDRGLWTGALIVMGTFALSIRWQWLREPGPLDVHAAETTRGSAEPT